MIKLQDNLIIGIDPDLHKSGIAIWNYSNNGFDTITSLYIWDIFAILKDLQHENCKILLEYDKSNYTWHKGGKGAAINVGKNKAVAIIIKEFLVIIFYCLF